MSHRQSCTGTASSRKLVWKPTYRLIVHTTAAESSRYGTAHGKMSLSTPHFIRGEAPQESAPTGD